MKKYRFKTREEFELIGRWIDDHGCPQGWAYEGEMNHYLGQEILASDCIALCESNDEFDMDGWSFSNHDYVVIEEENNIALAKKMYPIGTKFYPAHVISNTKEYCIVTNDMFSDSRDGIMSLTDEERFYDSSSKYGNTAYNRLVYHEGKWAEIVKEEEVVKEESLVGRWIKFLRQISSDQLKGSYDEIVKDDCKEFITLKKYKSCNKNRFRDREIELMPEGWSPLTEKTIPESIPTHVKCVQRLNDAQIGKIYRVVNRSQCECENDVLYLWDSIEFQLSSKQAYDAQSKSVDMKDVQEECKRRFPIGCTFKPVSSSYEYVLKDDHSTYSIHKDSQIYAHSLAGCLYMNGVYAHLVSLPKTKMYTAGIDPYETYPIYATVGDPLPTTKPLIDNVQSISVNLRTKKQINKLKF